MTSTKIGSRIVFGVLGPLELSCPGTEEQPRGKQAALLALLLMNANSWVGIGEICEALWGCAPPPSADRNVKTYVWQLRRTLPAADDGGRRLDGRRGGYRLRVSADELDVTMLERAAADGQHYDAHSDDTVARLQAVLALWRGRPYAELPDDAARVAVAGLEQRRWQVRERLADALIASARFADAVALLRPLTTEDPLREQLWARLVVALNGAGRRAEALSCFQHARRVLLEELGVEPDAVLQDAHRQVLSGESGASSSAFGKVLVPAAPSYLPRAIADFVGREPEVAALLGAQADFADVATIARIEGMPGVGKTALAVQVAHRLRGAYPDGQVFCDLHGHDPDAASASPADVLLGLLQAFGVPAAAVPAGLEHRAGMWRSLLNGRQVLLVLDDAISAAQVTPLLPGGGGSLALVTSRRRLIGLDGAHSLELDPLPDAEAHRLLSGTPASGGADDAQATVVQLCGNLPIALRNAAGRLRQRPSWDASSLARRLQFPRTRLAELRVGDRDLTVLFAMSYTRLSPAGRHLFRVLAGASVGDGCTACEPVRGLTAPELDIDEIARLADLPADYAERALDELLDHHLARECTGGRYAVHPLLRTFVFGLNDGDDDQPVPPGAFAHPHGSVRTPMARPA